ncbi:MAG TPA: spermidine/putrescine ABC transporter ATP-binding protein [Microbacterium sp.]|jgi:spermidine/putrescine transport system ATP-binding protein|uniref:ABC transporter ATP-binding protein n=1 Tax=Microbacterium TaxID=33882 RepID=UPI000C4408D1|nr:MULTISPECIES: ABC transporter ATP-binding protein [unclassified Microbacterium]MBU20945.1 spermidine/putrescine ABC transporter ATP-binding protein [Microbacterium sp.]HBS09986.1 spermidine/putrescine ABC transporter ATP-binding protein [Microbacterium sp.]HCM51503.1 spermidine/putrescine ABC transporter ATP-binding protein [Microbacterium sp.]|tara:strand:- start:9 stop:1154 length:1146 start_codon:yes stop_codon:yes gene_type:complete
MSTSTPEAGADLELRGIRKTFPGFTALHDLDLVIPAGSFFALLGPSGCGKTTTLRIVAGLERPTAGSISIGGKDVTSVPPHKRPVNTVFQSYALFPHMTVQENVEFGLRRRKVTDASSRALDALKLVELDHVAGRKPSQLSGGQQQRVALARAVVNRPALLLLDEPLGALDLKLRRQMQSELKTIQDEVGITFLHVTHDQEEAMTMADTVAVMNHGRIEQMGAPQELYELPRTGFVASFLGQSNLIAATVESAVGGTLVARTAAGGTLRMPIDRAVSTSGEITVGVRPEKLMLAAEAPTTDDNVLGPGRITDLSFTGVSTQYTVEMPGIGPVGVFEQNMVFGSVFSVGSEVWVRWRPEHTFGLDADAQAGAAEAIADSEDS